MPIVMNPTAGDIHVNTLLTNFSQKYLQDESAFVASVAMPNNPVAKQADLYKVFSRADFFRDQAKIRANGAETPGMGFTLSDQPYYAPVWGLHMDVTDQDVANADSVVQLNESAAQAVAQALLIRREVQFQQTYFPTAVASGIWDTEVVGSASPSGPQFAFWDRTDADPIADIRLGKQVIGGLTGRRPNRLLLSRVAWDTLLDNDAVLARITGNGSREQPAMVMQSTLAALMELEFIHVMDAVVNTAVEGATESTAYIAADNALLYYAPATAGLNSATAGVQFSWTGYTGATQNGMRFKRFRHEPTASHRVEGEMAFDYKVTGSELGYYFHNVRT